jgi:hypothetical protein
MFAGDRRRLFQPLRQTHDVLPAQAGMTLGLRDYRCATMNSRGKRSSTLPSPVAG